MLFHLEKTRVQFISQGKVHQILPEHVYFVQVFVPSGLFYPTMPGNWDIPLLLLGKIFQSAHLPVGLKWKGDKSRDTPLFCLQKQELLIWFMLMCSGENGRMDFV